MDCAKKLAHLLEGCGAKYTRIDAKEGTLFTVSTGDGQYFVLVRDDDAGIEMWSRYFTPEQAIVATVGRGNLTAEQVREAIMSADRWRKPMGDTGMTNTHLIIRDDGWQAIADELNATVGRRDTMGLWPEWEQVLFANVSDEVAQDNLNECVHDLLDKAATIGERTPDGLPIGLTVSNDGNLLNWVGENYVRQDAATVGTEPDEVTMLKLHDRMNAVLLDMQDELLAYHPQERENASSKELIDCVIRAHQIVEDAATVGAGTCHIEVHDNLAETEGMGDVWLECDECHWQMPLEPSTPRFKYCPNCRREVVDK